MINKSSLPGKAVFTISKSCPDSSIDRVEWTKQLDDYLGRLAREHKGKEWKAIACEMQIKFDNPMITAKKCRERWACCVNPVISKAALTDAECVLLLINHNNLQNRWSKMSKKIPRRYSSTLKNNFYSLIRSVLRRIVTNEFSQVTGLYLLQSTYVCWVAVNLLQRPDSYVPTKGDVPTHIRALIVEKGLTVSKCEEHLKAIVKGVIVGNPGKNLKPLEKYLTLKMFHELFVAVSPSLETRLEPISKDIPVPGHDTHPEIVEEIILVELEKVLNPASSAAASAPSLASKTQPLVPPNPSSAPVMAPISSLMPPTRSTHNCPSQPIMNSQPFQVYSFTPQLVPMPFVPPGPHFAFAPGPPPGTRAPYVPVYMLPSTFLDGSSGMYPHISVNVQPIYPPMPGTNRPRPPNDRP